MSDVAISINPTLAHVLGFWVAYCLAVYIFVVRRAQKMTYAKCGEPFNGFHGYIPGIGEVCHNCYIEYMEEDEK